MDKDAINRRLQTAAAKGAAEALQAEALRIMEEVGSRAIEQVTAAVADKMTIKRMIRDEQGRIVAVVPELLPQVRRRVVKCAGVMVHDQEAPPS